MKESITVTLISLLLGKLSSLMSGNFLSRAPLPPNFCSMAYDVAWIVAKLFIVARIKLKPQVSGLKGLKPFKYKLKALFYSFIHSIIIIIIDNSY